jgi:glycosyltransferase involved in cell wall biosynthesis
MTVVPEVCTVSDKAATCPKILIVSGEPLHRQSATGITLCNLFAGWPIADIAQVYSADYAPEAEFGSNTVRLTPRDLAPFCWWGDPHQSNTAAASHGVASIAGRRSARMRRYVSPVLELLPYRIPLPQFESLRAFRPDLIYSNLASIRIARLATWLARTLDVPLVPHFMDDWLSTYAVPGRSIGTQAHAAILNRQVRSIMHDAPLGLSIGQEMADEYGRRFGKPFHPFMNTVDVPDVPDAPRSFTPPVRFVYVGGLHLGRDESLAAVARSIGAVADAGPSELHIYAPESDGARARAITRIGPHVSFKGSVSPARVPEVLRDADVLVHVESFQPELVQFTRLSVSTKIPQYLAAARPIIAFGPDELASIQYVGRSGGGLCASVVAELEQALRTVIDQPQTRVRLGTIGWRQARAHHEATSVRRRFREVLITAAGSRSAYVTP